MKIESDRFDTNFPETDGEQSASDSRVKMSLLDPYVATVEASLSESLADLTSFGCTEASNLFHRLAGRISNPQSLMLER